MSPNPNSAVHDLTWHEFKLMILVDDRVCRRALLRWATSHGNQFLRAGETPLIPFPPDTRGAVPVEVDDLDTFPMRVYDE